MVARVMRAYWGERSTPLWGPTALMTKWLRMKGARALS